MTRPTTDQMLAMVAMQANRNNETMSGWIHSKVKFGRAIQDSCMQLHAALGWSLATDEQPDYVMAKAIAITLWQHSLSLSVKGMLGDREATAKQLDENLRHYPRMEVMSLLGKSFTLSGLTLHEAIDILSVFGALEYAFPALFENVMLGVGLTWAEVFYEVTGGEMTAEEEPPCVPTE